MAWALGISIGLRPYFTINPSSCPNTDTILTTRSCSHRCWKWVECDSQIMPWSYLGDLPILKCIFESSWNQLKHLLDNELRVDITVISSIPTSALQLVATAYLVMFHCQTNAGGHKIRTQLIIIFNSYFDTDEEEEKTDSPLLGLIQTSSFT